MKVKIFLLGLICLGVLVGLAYRFSPSQGAGQAKPTRAQRLFAKALPHLEKALGYKLPAQPEIRSATSKNLARLPGWELRGYMSWRFPALDKTVRDNAFRLGHHTDCLAAPVRHVHGTNVILVATEHLGEIAKWHDSLKSADSDKFLQLLLVHEAAKLTLENKYDLLDRRFDPRSLEEFKIGQALREGRAQWITREVAQSLGAGEQFPMMAGRWLHVPDFATDAKLRSITQTAFQQKYWEYAKGLSFFDFLEQSGRRDAEALAFSKPPRLLAWIENPELYLQRGISDQPSLRAVLTNLQKRHSWQGYKCRQQPLTPTMLRHVGVMLGAKQQAARVMDGWQDGGSLIWANEKRPGAYVAISVVKHVSQAATQAYYGFALDMQRKRDELSAKSPYIPLRVVESQFVPARFQGVDETMRNDKKLQVGGKGPAIPATVVLARSGNMVFEIQWQGIAADMNWGQSIVAEVLKSTRKS